LLVFSDDWGRHPSSCQHLVRRLADRHEIHWVNTIGMRTPRLNFASVRRGLEKVTHWCRRGSAKSRPDDDVHVHNPRMWPWFTRSWDRRLNRRLLTRQLRHLFPGESQETVAVTTLPIVADVMDTLPVARWVYYCVDDFGSWPGVDQRAMRSMEERVVARADVLIAVSEVLQDKLRAKGREAHLLTHGVDGAFWSPSFSVDAPELARFERPCVLFFGVVDRRQDLGFLDRLGKEMTAGTIVLLGPRDNPDPALKQVPRLVCLPPVPYHRLPFLAGAADALIMPYDVTLPVNQALQPLKLKEYLATGKPVVVSNIPATRSWADCLDIASSPAEFSRSVRKRLETGLPQSQCLGRQRLVSEDWSIKAEQFEKWVFG
jgi:glycosyltransferase involved in cell wall biosynthesis